MISGDDRVEDSQWLPARASSCVSGFQVCAARTYDNVEGVLAFVIAGILLTLFLHGPDSAAELIPVHPGSRAGEGLTRGLSTDTQEVGGLPVHIPHRAPAPG